LVLALALVGLVGCPSDDDDDVADDDVADDDTGDDDTGDDDTGDDDTGDDDTTSPTDVPIYDIQGGVYATNDIVSVLGVVVTSPQNSTNSFFIQEPTGGQYSGIYVYCSACVGGEVAQGDVVDVTGSYTEYYGLTEISADPADISVTGTAPVPAPATVAVCDIAAAGGPLSEPYESVLVQVVNVTVSAEADGYGEWELDSCTNVNDMFYAHTPTLADTLTSVIGPLNYDYGEFKIEPRDASDIAP